MYDVKGWPSTVMSTRRAGSFATTFTCGWAPARPTMPGAVTAMPAMLEMSSSVARDARSVLRPVNRSFMICLDACCRTAFDAIAASMRAPAQRADADRLEPDLIAVVLHQDVTLLKRAETGDILELA